MSEQPRNQNGQFVKKITGAAHDPSPYPPLISFSLTNPVTYLKLWWHRVMWGEGIDIKFRIKPVTAFGLAIIFTLGGFGLGRFTLPPSNPIIKYIPQLAPSPTPNPYRDTAFSGILKLSGINDYYLITAQSEAITLTVPSNINLKKYIDSRIFATGRYNQITGILVVTDASSMEVLPLNPSPIPTLVPSPTLTSSPTVTPEVFE